MTFLDRIFDAANGVYPDGLISLHRDMPKGNHGDGLAKFIVTELSDVCCGYTNDAEVQAEAVRALDVAIRELQDVQDAISNLEVADAED